MRDWKETLLMPETDFSMKAGLINKEPIFRKMWLDNNIYEKVLNQNINNKKFILHDGPPYANGNLHVGHAFNKIIKDIIVRYKSMQGFYAPFVPGWDTHGLPIENKMLSEMGKTQNELDKLELRIAAKEYALTQVEQQKSQFEKMQLLSDLKDKYLTLNPEFEVKQLKLLKKMALEGLIYKGLKPVYWSPSSQSALAEAEVEYADHRSPQVIVSFDVVDEEYKLLIMTTTPWTLIANSGVAVGSNYDYSVVQNKDDKFIIATVLIDSVSALAKWESYEIISTFKGSELIGKTYIRPIKNDLMGKIVSGHHVTTDAGTGLVHMAPLFGEDDYIIGKQNNLDMIMHVEGDGKFNNEAGKYEGLFYADANKDIGMYLDSKGSLLSLKFIKHSYPMDWRTHKPVIFRGVPQWFVSIDKIKDNILNELSDIDSYPEWGVSRISNMIENRSDWTISRQRTWGVPIIVFYDEDKKPLIVEELFDHAINIISEKGTNIWWEATTDELLPESHRGKGYTREMDIMDVWFDSGSSHLMFEEKFGVDQADLYFEGSDQYRGWFNSSLINSVAFRGKSPYKQLVSHGFVLDGKQQKMSKSKGNVVDPLKIIDKQGADILRLWAANSEYTSDVTISDDIIKQTVGLYRNIRTKLRFMLGNLKDYDNSENYKKPIPGSIHEYILIKHNKYVLDSLKDFDGYKIQKVVKQTSEHITDLSSWYLDIAKDSLYADSANSEERRQYQSNIYHIVLSTMLLLAPILPTTIEEAYSMFKINNKKESVFLENFFERVSKESLEIHASTGLIEKIDNLFSLKDSIYKSIEDAKQTGIIKRSNQSTVIIGKEYNATDFETFDLKKMFMVSAIQWDNNREGIEIKNEDFNKCNRCWNHYNEINNENICARCENVVKEV